MRDWNFKEWGEEPVDVKLDQFARRRPAGAIADRKEELEQRMM